MVPLILYEKKNTRNNISCFLPFGYVSLFFFINVSVTNTRGVKLSMGKSFKNVIFSHNTLLIFLNSKKSNLNQTWAPQGQKNLITILKRDTAQLNRGDNK